MNKTIKFVLILAVVFGGLAWLFTSGVLNPDEKIYVAVEGEAKIAVIDPAKGVVIKNIDLTVDHEGGKLSFAPHNVQVAPDGESVWVTANAGSHEGHASFLVPAAHAHGDEENGAEPDEVIVINPKTEKIIKRIPVFVGIHLAHVAITPDGNFAYITAQKEGAIYKINTKTFEIEKRIQAPSASEPHGLRIAPDGKTAYIAMLGSKALGLLDLTDDTLTEISAGGAAVQAGVTPDGTTVFLSLYDVKALGIYDVATKAMSSIPLPNEARGPVQMYSTPDSRYVYLADQGYYFGAPTSEMVYKIDLKERRVVKEIRAGTAPHGVVVSKDGKRVYVTNLLTSNVSVIDTTTDTEIAQWKVGKEPNGISIWSKSGGGTP